MKELLCYFEEVDMINLNHGDSFAGKLPMKIMQLFHLLVMRKLLFAGNILCYLFYHCIYIKRATCVCCACSMH